MKKAKVFLLETSVESQNIKMGEQIEDGSIQFSIGLLYLDAALKNNGYEVITRDYAMWSEENCLREIKKIVMEFKPDFVGISVMSMTRVSTFKAIKLIKQMDKNIKIILGGIHSNVMYRQLLESFPIEAICLGEADDSLIELLDSLIKNKPLAKIKGIAYNAKGKVVVTKIRGLRTNLDELPFPSYDVFMNPKIKQVQMTSSRGCPNKCSFCCLDVISRRVWRPRSPKSVVDEIEFITKKYPWVQSIQFIDDTMTLDNNRVIKICKEIIKRNIYIKFRCQGRIKPISKEMIYWMEKAGFIEICFGIETGSAELLKSIHKNITKEDCLDTFKVLSKFKRIKVVKFLMVGFPGETDETVRETINLVKELQKLIKMDFFYASPLWIYPGTEVYEICKDRGALTDDFWLSDNPCPIFTLENSEEQLIKWSNQIALETMLAQGKAYFIKVAVKKVLKNPSYYLRRLFNTTDLKGI